MAYDTYLAERIRLVLSRKHIHFTERKMMGGLCFMVDDKMLAGIVQDDLMARIGPEAYEKALESDGVRPMDFTGRSMLGYVFVSAEAIDLEEQLEFWIQLCLDFNPLAKSSKKKR